MLHAFAKPRTRATSSAPFLRRRDHRLGQCSGMTPERGRREPLLGPAAAIGYQDACGSGDSEQTKSKRGRIDPATTLYLHAIGTTWMTVWAGEVVATDVATRIADHLEDCRAEEGCAEYECCVRKRRAGPEKYENSSCNPEQADSERSRVKHHPWVAGVDEPAEPAGLQGAAAWAEVARAVVRDELVLEVEDRRACDAVPSTSTATARRRVFSRTAAAAAKPRKQTASAHGSPHPGRG